MITKITEGVRVTVETEFQSEFSNPSQSHYVFTYKITIENKSPCTIQLLRRHWYIHDTNWPLREVEGEGVVGLQPILEPGQSHQYVSGCNLRSGFGKMHGTFLMEKVLDGKLFQVAIPEFNMAVPFRLN
jgi:ApaG protein